MLRMPSSVSVPEVVNSASPVASVKVRSSKISRSAGRPYSPVTMSWMRRATSSLRSAVFAMPCSSIVSAITAAPYFTTSGITASSRARPFSRLIEFTIATPG